MIKTYMENNEFDLWTIIYILRAFLIKPFSPCFHLVVWTQPSKIKFEISNDLWHRSEILSATWDMLWRVLSRLAKFLFTDIIN